MTQLRPSMGIMAEGMAQLRPSMGIMCRPLKKTNFFHPNDVFLIMFLLGHLNRLQITKNDFLCVLAFCPLISMFHALWHSSWRRTFRDLSIHIKNSSFHAVWLGIRKSIENLSKIYRTSIEHLSKIYRKSIEHLSKIYRKFEYRARCNEMKNF